MRERPLPSAHGKILLFFYIFRFSGSCADFSDILQMPDLKNSDHGGRPGRVLSQSRQDNLPPSTVILTIVVRPGLFRPVAQTILMQGAFPRRALLPSFITSNPYAVIPAPAFARVNSGGNQVLQGGTSTAVPPLSKQLLDALRFIHPTILLYIFMMIVSGYQVLFTEKFEKGG